MEISHNLTGGFFLLFLFLFFFYQKSRFVFVFLSKSAVHTQFGSIDQVFGDQVAMLQLACCILSRNGQLSLP